MKRFEVRFQPQAQDDLVALYDYIAHEAGGTIAEAYIGRIETACRSLETFPERGTRRDYIVPGLRTMGFERRATWFDPTTSSSFESSMAAKTLNAR